MAKADKYQTFESLSAAVRHLSKAAPSSPVIRLPYLWVPYKEFLTPEGVTDGLSENQIYERRQGRRKDMREGTIIVSSFTRRGQQHHALLLSEASSDHPEGPRQITVYHRVSPDRAFDIISHGFYQIPQRDTFYAKPGKGYKHIEAVYLTFKLSVEDLVFSELANDGVDVFALAFSRNRVGARLPQKLKTALRQSRRGKDPQAYGGNYEDLLLLAEEAGLLMHIPPERIDINETLKANELHVADGTLSQQRFNQLKNALEKLKRGQISTR